MGEAARPVDNDSRGDMEKTQNKTQGEKRIELIRLSHYVSANRSTLPDIRLGLVNHNQSSRSVGHTTVIDSYFAI